MKKGLGKGLAALIGDLDEDIESQEVKEKNEEGLGQVNSLPIELLIPNREQPRKTFNDESIKELADSVKEKGVLLPILVRPIKDKKEYQIIAGERRWRASQIAGLHDVPVVIRNFNESEVLEIGLIENMQRALDILVEADLKTKEFSELGSSIIGDIVLRLSNVARK